jgi:pilin isopeptide linkage protein
MNRVNFRKRAAFFVIFLLAFVMTNPSRTFAQGDEPVDISLEIEEYIEGDYPEDEDVPFTFILEPDDENAPVPDENYITIVGEGTAQFDDIEFTKSGEYEYTVWEEEGDHPNYTYDNSVYHITVQVVYGEDGELHAIVSGHEMKSEEKTAEIVFLNEYVEPEEPSEEPTTEDEPNTQEKTTEETTTEVTATEDTPTADTPTPATVQEEPTTVTNTSSTTTKVAKTGDSFQLTLWIAILLICLAAIVEILILRRRRNGSK